MPEPGTQLTAEYGTQLFYDGYITDFNFPRLESDDRSLLVGDPVIFANHHYYPSRLPRDRHVFVTSAWRALRKAGRSVMVYVLRAFNGTLSTFMDEACDWRATRPDSAGPVSVEDIVAFLVLAEERHRLEQRLQDARDENRERKDDRERNQKILTALGLLLLSSVRWREPELQAGPDLRLIASFEIRLDLGDEPLAASDESHRSEILDRIEVQHGRVSARPLWQPMKLAPLWPQKVCAMSRSGRRPPSLRTCSIAPRSKWPPGKPLCVAEPPFGHDAPLDGALRWRRILAALASGEVEHGKAARHARAPVAAE